MSENLTDGTKLSHAAPSWVTNDSGPVGRIARSEGLVSHRRRSRDGGLSSGHPLVAFLSRLLSIPGVSLLADDHRMHTVAEDDE